ncbi:MAG: cell surface protein, partial [Verrucomicrobiales bacterium]|nr:cell surface protein [Verrucomicrobiales bacterium]
PLTEKQTAVLPQVRTRAQPGNTGDPYADRVVRFSPLAANGYGSGALPANVTGPPDGRDTYAPASKPGEVLSLHARVGSGGFIELEFTDNIVEIGPGEDLTVFENVLFIGRSANQRFMEPAVISVALYPGEWHALPCDVIPPAGDQPLDLRDPFYYARGIAGRNPTSGEDPTDPSRSGGDSLDLEPATAAAGLSWIRYIRIQSTGDQSRTDDVGGDSIRHTADPAFSPLTGSGNSGFDLDAVSAVHY